MSIKIRFGSLLGWVLSITPFVSRPNLRSNNLKDLENLHRTPSSDYFKAVNKLKKILPKLAQCWEENQKVFPDDTPPQDWENTLHDFYNDIWNELPDSLKSKAPNYTNFENSTLDYKSAYFKYLKELSYSEYNDIIDNFLQKMDKGKLVNLKKICLSLFGGDHHKVLADPLHKLINSNFKKFFQSIENLGKDFSITYLGSGSVGIAFAVDISGHKFVIKFPKVPSYRRLSKHFDYEQKQLKLYHDLVKKGFNPAKLSIPELVCDSEGKPLSIDGKITVTKFYQGEKLNYKSLSETNRVYITRGLNSKFLLDFIKLYMQFVKEGADLNDISVDNYFYNKDTQTLVFFELAGLDPEHSNRFNQVKELKDESIYASLIFTLITAISTIEHSIFSVIYSREITNQARSIEQGNIFDKRIVQLKKVLNKAIIKNILNRQELQEGIEYLYKVCSSPKVNPNLKISQRGLEYLGWLKEWIKK